MGIDWRGAKHRGYQRWLHPTPPHLSLFPCSELKRGPDHSKPAASDKGVVSEQEPREIHLACDRHLATWSGRGPGGGFREDARW